MVARNKNPPGFNNTNKANNKALWEQKFEEMKALSAPQLAKVTKPVFNFQQQQNKPKEKTALGFIESIVMKAWTIFSKLSAKPSFLFVLFASFLVVSSHDSSLDGFLRPYLDQHSNNTFVKWAEDNSDRFFAAIAFAPAILAAYEAKQGYLPWTIGIVVFIVMFAPIILFIEYTVISGMLILILYGDMNMKRGCLLAFVLMVYLGWFENFLMSEL